MDIVGWMDSVSLDECKHSHKRTRRMQSWYMYEQYKSLERNQTEAAQKLKDKSNQDRILHQEMAERRERRRLCEEPGCQSETGIDSIKSDVKSCVSASNDDFFETFSDIHNEEVMAPTRQLSAGKLDMDEYMSIENKNDDSISTYVESEKSDKTLFSNANLIYNAASSRDNLADDIKEELKFAKKNIAENISLQLETVKDSIQCLEEFTKFRDSDQLSKYDYDSESVGSRETSITCAVKLNETENNVFAMWSKLVSFAYQIVQLNHGNCYYDYSSQFLTAVLAFDVLRMGINKICTVLQPYVTPIEFVADECGTKIVKQKCHKHVKKKKCVIRKKFKKNFQSKCLLHGTKPKTKMCSCVRSYLSDSPNVFHCCDNKQSDDSWGQYSFENMIKERGCRILSEPMRSVAKFSYKMPSEKTSSSIWPEEYSIRKFSDENLSFCHAKVANPMLKLASYIDDVFKDIDYSKNM